MNGQIRLIVAAAGLGTRLDRSEPKALVPVAGMPLLVRTLNAFAPLRLAQTAIVLHPPEHKTAFEQILSHAFPDNTIQLAPGGRERQDSIRLGLRLVDETTTLVVLHDAARPFIAAPIIEEALDAARAYGGATVATPAVDTILQTDTDDMLASTPDRTRLWACQTPQVFHLQPFSDAHARAHAAGRYFTDDATLFKHYGGRVKIVQGSPENRKITTQEDLLYAEYRLGAASRDTQLSG